MKQLTSAEKQQLAGKITKQQERQQTLREANPDLPESFEEASAKTGPFKYGFLEHLWNYGFLGIILCLLAHSVFLLIRWRNFGSNKLGFFIALMLLFNHIAFFLTKTGWKHRVMKTVAFVWIVLVWVYIYISWDA